MRFLFHSSYPWLTPPPPTSLPRSQVYIHSITGSVITSFLYIASLEWLLRGLDSGEFLGIQAPGLFKNGFRMAVVSVIIMCVVLFFRKGIMGDRELTDLLKRKKNTSKGGARNG